MIFIAAVPAAPAAYVSSVHHRPLCSTLATCGHPRPGRDESPAEPDHDNIEGHLWVQTVTGGPSELSPLPQVSFSTALLTPLGKLEFVSEFTRARSLQTRALGQTRRSPSKMRGR